MSVIVAKSSCCGWTTPTPETNCIPASALRGIIAVGETGLFGESLVSEYAAIKLHVVLMNDSGSHARSFEVFALHQQGTMKFVAYSFAGYKFAINIDVVIVAGKMQLSVTNNDGEDINVYVTQLSVPYALNASAPTEYIDITTNQTIVQPTSTQCIDTVNDVGVGVKWSISVETSAGETIAFQAMSIASSVNQYAVVGNDATSYQLEVATTPFGTQLLLVNTSSNVIRVVVTRIPLYQIPHVLPSCGSASAAPAWAEPSKIIPPNTQSTVFANVDPNIVKSSKWLITLTNTTTMDVYGFEMIASIPTNSFSRYAVIGTYQDMTVELLNNPANLSITNNTASPIQANILHVPVGL